MKKVLLMAVSAFSGLYAMAQVNIDWSVDEVVAPTQLNSNTATGTAVNYDFVCKNNGADNALSGDTVLFQLFLFNASNQLIVAAPSTTSSYFRVLSRDVNSSDTIHVVGGFTFPLYPNFSQNVNLVVVASIRNMARNIAAEGSGTTSNNTKVAPMVWYNPQGWGVNVSQIGKESGSVYPNQTSGKFNIALPVSSVSETTLINIYNMQGRLLQTENLGIGEFSKQIDASGLPTGTYVVEALTGSFKSSQKLVIAK